MCINSHKSRSAQQLVCTHYEGSVQLNVNTYLLDDIITHYVQWSRLQRTN